MTDKEIVKLHSNDGRVFVNMYDMMEFAREDEREKMTQEKFAEYFNRLKGGEVASAILTQLLRRGVTDDDLRGMRLQWITDERAKLSKEGVKVWISWGTHFTFQRLTAVKPELFEYNGGVAYLNNGNAECIILPYFSELLGLKEGECKAFEIRECL